VFAAVKEKVSYILTTLFW